MREFVAKWAVSVFSGFLIGLMVAYWIDPRTPGGFILILLICIAVAVVVSASATLISQALSHRRSQPAKTKPPMQDNGAVGETIAVERDAADARTAPSADTPLQEGAQKLVPEEPAAAGKM